MINISESLQLGLERFEHFHRSVQRFRKTQNPHLPLDVVLEQVLVHRVQVIAAHVVVVVGHGVAELLPVGTVFHIV